ncbi:MAG: hypothetical protein QGI18_05780 [Candidatus Marinimicrobia bacterium]|nr:hypothetical protein [Candidatus Neomarinimicrobiota bacterium]
MNGTDANYLSGFPSQVVPIEEKNSWEYGLKVARAIENEWFSNNRYGAATTRTGLYQTNYAEYHNRRLYARGEQSIQKYKDELSINGDLSYLNLDWKPVPIISKFVDIVVNGLSDREYEIKAFAQDPESLKRRTNYARDLMRDMLMQEYLVKAKNQLGMDLSASGEKENLPETTEELEMHMQLSYKQSIEIAEEEAISQVLAENKYDQTKRRLIEDLVILGISSVKTNFNAANGITVEYVDPANLVYSYSTDPNFQDLYYVGEVKMISMGELKKQFPYLTDAQLKKIEKFPGEMNYLRNWNEAPDVVAVLFFEYKTYMDQIFKIKYTEQGLEKALEKPDTFNPPETDNFDRVGRSIEVLYTGAKVLGINEMIKWEMSQNMTRPYADNTKVRMNYSICAPKLYHGRVESIVSKITGFADMIQLTHLKLQQVISRMVPDGVFVDADGLAEVDLGNGTNYNPQEALNMYFQTGSIVGRSLTQDGDPNRGKVPIQELQTSAAGNKLQSLITTYNYYLQMIRDVTGLNEARDASTPDPEALVGVQKLAAYNSNVATRHILNGALYLGVRVAENISLRLADCLEHDLLAQALKSSISTFNVETIDEIKNLSLHDFGIFLELEPDEEERMQLEQNIQVALQTQGIDLEDAIDIRQINNVKLANQYLKLRRKKKQQHLEQQQQLNIQMQAESNAKSAEQAALYEVQKQQAIAQTQLQIEEGKSQLEQLKIEKEGQIKKELMQLEFQYQMELAQLQAQVTSAKEAEIEDRKDQRTKLQATQQSELISQRQDDSLPIDFETPTGTMDTYEFDSDLV